MPTVTALQYDTLTDVRPMRDGGKAVVFEPQKVERDGAKLWLGVAEVSGYVARTYYVGHPGFKVEGLDGDADVEAEEAFAGEGEHRVEESSPGWWKLIGPDGQVGKSVRSEADAWALLESDD